MSDREPRRPMRLAGRHAGAALRLLGIVAASGSIPAILNAIFGKPTWREAAAQTLSGMVFAGCIGGLCSLVLPRIAERILRLQPALKWLTLIATIVTLALAGCGLANLIFLLAGTLTPETFERNYAQSAKLCVLITLSFGISAFFHEVIVNRLSRATAEIKSREEAEKKLQQIATEARLSSLESRVQPHFLFNTLNSILTLIREDPAKSGAHGRAAGRAAPLLA